MPDARPNIVYFICHDVSKHLGCYGVPVATPNVDAFARQAVRFDNAFCNAPACTPSRCCAMTGLHAHTSGAVGLAHMGWPLSEDVPTVVDYLNDGGYQTIHSGMEHERHPRMNRYQVDLQVSWDDFRADVAVDKALDYLEDRSDDRPFYLNVGSQQPHASTWGSAEELYGGPVPREDVWMPLYCKDTPEQREQLARFQAAIGFMDEHFGRLLRGLERLGLGEDTIVVFTTDHGISAPRSKGTLYERGVEIALLVRLPDARMAGTSVEHLIQNIDFAPTLLEAAGVPRPEELQGRSFWPLLDGGDYGPHDAVFIERNFHGERPFPGADRAIDLFDPIRAVRTPEYHYIRWFRPEIRPRYLLLGEEPLDPETVGQRFECATPPTGRPRNAEELYDIRHDPLEFVNVADRPEYREVKADLSQRLEDWMVRTDDFMPDGPVPERPEEPGWGPDWPREGGDGT